MLDFCFLIEIIVVALFSRLGRAPTFFPIITPFY